MHYEEILQKPGLIMSFLIERQEKGEKVSNPSICKKRIMKFG